MSASSDDSIRRCAALATAAALMLAGCGQTGPLYLPERGEVVVRPAAEPVPLQTVLGKDGAAPLTIEHPARGPSFRRL